MVKVQERFCGGSENLKVKLESGQPFFSVEACIDAILLLMAEETKSTIHGCEEITSQARKMTEYVNNACVQQGSNSNSRSPKPESSTPGNADASSEQLTAASATVAGAEAEIPLPSPTNIPTDSSQSSLPPLQTKSR